MTSNIDSEYRPLSVTLINDDQRKGRRPYLVRSMKTYWKEVKACILSLPSILFLFYTLPLSTLMYLVLNDIAHDIAAPPDQFCIRSYNKIYCTYSFH